VEQAVSPPTPQAKAQPAASSAKPSDCRQRLAPEIAVITPLPPVVGPGACRIDDPVRLEAIWTRAGHRIVVKPAATLGCGLAETLAQFVRDDVNGTLLRLGRSIASLNVDAAFDCRPRNRVEGAQLSQHGLGNAIDVHGVTFSDGTSFSLTDAAAPKDQRTKLRELACARFTTVLGPGSDGYHESHIHLDVMARHNGYRICHWEVH
jgi:hypothetical protein